MERNQKWNTNKKQWQWNWKSYPIAKAGSFVPSPPQWRLRDRLWSQAWHSPMLQNSLVTRLEFSHNGTSIIELHQREPSFLLSACAAISLGLLVFGQTLRLSEIWDRRHKPAPSSAGRQRHEILQGPKASCVRQRSLDQGWKRATRPATNKKMSKAPSVSIQLPFCSLSKPACPRPLHFLQCVAAHQVFQACGLPITERIQGDGPGHSRRNRKNSTTKWFCGLLPTHDCTRVTQIGH